MTRRTARAVALLLVAACGETAAPTDASPGAATSARPPAADASGAATTPAGDPPADDRLAPTPGADAGPPPRGDGWFTDVTAWSGIAFVHDAGVSPERQLPETMGAGAALADLDRDGDLDVYLVQSGSLPIPGRTRARRPVNRLFANAGDGRFADVTDASGAAAHDGYGMGVAVGDVDGDGLDDLLVTNVGPDVLLRNEGALRFSDATAGTDLADPRWTGSAAFHDADGDGDLDLSVAAYVGIDLTDPEWCGRREEGWRSYCHPDAYEGLQDRHYRNDGRGGFTDVTAEAGLVTRPGHHGKGLGMLAADLDDDGDVDLYVANDSVENRMWLGLGDGRFEDGTLLSATGVNGRGLTEAGMGVAAGDVDGDGDADLFVTNFDDESNTLYRNDGGGLFTDVTASAGLDAPSRLPVGFGTVLADLDADGDLDCAVTNGHIIDNIHLYHDGKTHAQRALLFENDGRGRFTDVSVSAGALTADAVVGRGLYDGDLDGDGDRDLLLTVCDGPARVLRNDGPPGRAAGGSVVLDGLPRGARVEAVRDDGLRLVRVAGPQPSYFGQTSGRVHLGLGDAALASLAVRLPNGGRLEHVFGPSLARGRLLLTPTGDLQVVGTGGTMHGSSTPPADTSSPTSRTGADR